MIKKKKNLLTRTKTKKNTFKPKNMFFFCNLPKAKALFRKGQALLALGDLSGVLDTAKVLEVKEPKEAMRLSGVQQRLFIVVFECFIFMFYCLLFYCFFNVFISTLI